MLVQPISQTTYNTQSNVNFEAHKLKKFDANFFVIDIHARRPGEQKAIKEIIKKYNLGKLGLVSMRKLKDILLETSKWFRYDNNEINQYRGLIKEKDNEIANRDKEISRLANLNKSDAETRKAEYKQKEEDLNNQYKEKFDNLSAREKELEDSWTKREDALKQKEEDAANKENELKERESKLNKRAADIEFIEDMVRKESTEKIRTEVLEEADARYKHKMEEIQTLEGNLRAIYDKKLPKNNKRTNSFGEQMLIVTESISKMRTSMTNLKPSTPADITKALRNKKGELSDDMMQFLDRILKTQSKCDCNYLPTAINIVKDIDGNIDTAKAAQLIAFSAWGNSLSTTIIEMLKLHNDKNMLKAEGVVDTILHDMKLEFQKDEDGLYILTGHYKPISSFKNKYGIPEDCLFEHIKEIQGDAIFDHSEVTNLGKLKRIGKDFSCEYKTKVVDFGDLEYVGGNAYFRKDHGGDDTKIRDENRKFNVRGEIKV